MKIPIPSSNRPTSAMGNLWSVVLATSLTLYSGVCNAGPEFNQQCIPSVRDSRVYDATLRKIADCIDHLHKEIEEWGVITVSAPVVMNVKGQFVLDGSGSNSYTEKGYIDLELNNVNGASVVSTETGITNQFTGTATPTFQTNKDTGLPEPVLSTAAPDYSKLTPANFNISNTLSSAAPAEPLGLISKLTTTRINPVRNSIIQGVNDKLTEEILSTMANPPWEKFANRDYGIYFAIIQVSCNPGWRTRENYIGDLSATCEYYDSKNRLTAPDCDQNKPLVFSVLPLIDAQNLELGNSDRQLTALAAQIAASYPTIGLSLLGQDLISFVHRYQKDSITRTPITVTNSYSTGQTFGFRFAPSFRAQKDPAYKKSGAANILQATTIPVLVTVVVNLRDLGLLDSGTTGTNAARKCPYDSIRTQVSTSWLINDRPPLTKFWRRLYTPMEREQIAYRIGWAKDLSCIKTALNEIENNIRDHGSETLRESYDPIYDTLKSETAQLASKCVPQSNLFMLCSQDTIKYWNAKNEAAKKESDAKEAEAKEKENKANTVSITITHDNDGNVNGISFDKRSLGNVSGEKLADMISQILKPAGKE